MDVYDCMGARDARGGGTDTEVNDIVALQLYVVQVKSNVILCYCLNEEKQETTKEFK